MVEIGKDYRIGLLRMKYLDLANVSFAQGNYPLTDGYIKDFLDTVDGDGDVGKQITKEFDEIIARKKKDREALEKYVNTLGYLEQKDVKNKGMEEIEINAIHDRKNICWTIALKEGLFND